MNLEIPENFKDVAVDFSREEWNTLTKEEKDLHRDVMVENYMHMITVGYNLPNLNLFLLLEKHEKLVPAVKEEILSSLQRDLSKVAFSISRSASNNEVQSQKEHRNSECAKSVIKKMPFARNIRIPLRKCQYKSVENSNSINLANDQELQLQSYKMKKMYKHGEYKKNFISTSTFVTHFQSCTKKRIKNSIFSCLVKNSKTFQGSKRRDMHHEGMVLDQKIYTENKPYNWSRCEVSFIQNCELIEGKNIHSRKTGPIHISTIKKLKHLKKLNRKKLRKHAACSNGIVLKDSLTSPKKACTEVKPYKCATCGKSFTQTCNLKFNDKIHSLENPYTCATCNKNLGSPKIHEKIPTKVKIYKCETCNKSYTRKSTLTTHEKIHTGEKPYKCATCGKSFTKKSNLTVHERIHTGKKPYTCATCGKSFIQKVSLISHGKLHTGEQLFKCQTCGKNFTKKSNLAVHERIHKGEKPYECTTCGKSFIRKYWLAFHMESHSEDKPYKCIACSKTFSVKQNLVIHERTHTRGKPYTCETCGKSFRWKKRLAVHEKGHNENKPYICATCGKSFTRKYNLRAHGKLHTGEHLYKCTACDKHFTKKRNLAVHERIHLRKVL
ncbi:gastrula zinc finger protein XlCGF57.1-like [Protopterus annectens]|uniref:gastrula zinc finger protein XlCGF57.1-like n=1 Tax=Protopterus annectens TaxID=7888 RepID=UPI001CFAF200|nr:gastrula zinc finger protein XlCGF57.1-like [Protopterus annectens]